MSTCSEERAPELAALAAGEVLPAARRAELEGHLAGCEACQAEVEALAGVLELAALPPASELELHALGALPGQVRAAWQAQVRTRRRDARVVLGGLVGLAATLVLAFHVAVPSQRMASDAHAEAQPVAAATPRAAISKLADDATDMARAVDALPGGPVEVALDGDDGPFAYDPEVAPAVFTDEGEQ